MAANDDRKVIEAKVEKDGTVSANSLNTALRQISEMIYKIEGRKGPSALRDSLTVASDSNTIPLTGTGVDRGRVELAFRGTGGEKLELSQQVQHRGDSYVAEGTTATGVSLGPAGLEFHYTTGLTPGQYFIPTTIGTGTAAGLLGVRYGARVKAAAVSIPDSTDTNPTFTSATWNVGTLFSGGAPTLLTLPVAGVWMLSGWISYAFNATGNRYCAIDVTGMRVTNSAIPATTSNNTDVNASTPWRAVAGDTVKLVAFQNSGGPLSADVYLTAQLLSS